MKAVKAPWVILAPAGTRTSRGTPAVAICKRCGENIEQPILPMDMDQYNATMQAALKAHARCQDPEVVTDER